MSLQIYIEHNPFIIDTKFLINGEMPASNTFERYKNSRLQLWIEQLFTDLKEYSNGINDFEITFKGVEADWLDLELSANDAKREGFNINLNYIPTKESSERLADIKALMEEAKNHPIFGEEILKNKEIQRDFKEADNRDFDVYVVATMSAGKSTFINAMLGCELLPAANEATTATIATITDNDTYSVGEFTGVRIDKDNQEVDKEEKVDLITMQRWNSENDTRLIELEGNIISIKEREEVRLKVTDTPGPNNSQDSEHERITMAHIEDSVRNPLIIYLLNGTQLGVNDDQKVLTDIAEIMKKGGKQSKDRFIFVANKMDSFDEEKGESVEKALIRIRKYLEENGIENPQIYPVSAIATLLHRKKMNKLKLTKSENASLSGLEILFGDPEEEGDVLVDFVKHMPLTKTSKKSLENKNLVNIEYRSGVAAIESMIDEYIAKYNVPNRVNRAEQALSKAIEKTTNAAELIKALEKYSTDLLQIEEQINLLNSDKSRASNLQSDINKELGERTSSFIKKNITAVDKIETGARTRINEFGNNFSGKVTKARAESEIKNLTIDLGREYNRIINDLEALHTEAQKNMRNQLSDIFHNKVQQELVFLKKLPLPLLEGIKHQFESLEQFSDLGLSDMEVDERTVSKKVKVGVRKVSTSRWYKPWTWGDSKMEDIYETKDEIKEEVSLDDVWKNRQTKIRENFNTLISSGIDKLEKDISILANEFSDFMKEEFIKHTDAIMEDLLSKARNSEELKIFRSQAEDNLNEINNFKEKLNKVLAI